MDTCLVFSSKAITEYREKWHTNQEALANLLGVKASTLSRWERGVAVPSATATLALGLLLFQKGCAVAVPPPAWATGRLDPAKAPQKDGKLPRVLTRLSGQKEFEVVITQAGVMDAVELVKTLTLTLGKCRDAFGGKRNKDESSDTSSLMSAARALLVSMESTTKSLKTCMDVAKAFSVPDGERHAWDVDQLVLAPTNPGVRAKRAL
jgi:DNA-binding XRE family transcriptional regulator